MADVHIEASINPARVAVGEPIELTIVITGAGSGIKTPVLPQFKNFTAYSQGHSEEISFINGVMSSRTVFSYALVPSLEGRHVLGSMDVPIGNKIYQTGNLEVEVTPPGSSPSRVSQGFPGRGAPPPAHVVPPSAKNLPPEYMTGQEIFVRVWVDKDEVYLNEPVHMTYTIFTRASATFKGFDEEPETTGFWVEEFPPPGLATRNEKDIGGYRYIIADVRTLALFPTEAGAFDLNPGVLKVDVEIQRGDPFSRFQSIDIFGRRRYRAPTLFTEIESRLLQTDIIKIKVKPLPEKGRPADFNGAVGHFTLESSLDHTNVEERQPVTYRVKLSGVGNLNTANLPQLPPMDHFKYYDSSSSLNLHKDRYRVEGDKTSETVLLPRKKGIYKIPKLNFSFFDPSKEEYVTLSTQSHDLKVTESTSDEPPPAEPAVSTAAPKGVAILDEDIHYLKNNPGMPRTLKRPDFISGSFWLWHGLAPLLAFLLLGLAILTERFSGVGVKRTRSSHRFARKRLMEAKSHLKRGQESDFYEALSQSVNGYFADKLRLEPGAVGLSELERRLSPKITPTEFSRVRELLTQIDFGRFARSGSSLEEMKRLYTEADEVITLLEKKRL